MSCECPCCIVYGPTKQASPEPMSLEEFTELLHTECKENIQRLENKLDKANKLLEMAFDVLEGVDGCPKLEDHDPEWNCCRLYYRIVNYLNDKSS